MTVDEIIQEALRLSDKERAILGELMFDSLVVNAHDRSKQSVSENTWAEEISRRVDEVKNGTAQLISWTEAKRRLHAKIAERVRQNAK